MGEIDVTAFVADLVPAMTRRVPYRPPDEDECVAIEALAAALGRGETADVAALGLEATVSGNTLVLASDPTSERAWLVVVLRPGVVPDVVVEVPHPNADLDTELVGLALRDRRAGALLLQAGAHRIAGAPPEATDRVDCPADVSSRADAPFSRVASVLTARGLPQIQLHGFADRDGVDVVLSPGAAAGGPLLDAVEARLRAAGERVGTGRTRAGPTSWGAATSRASTPRRAVRRSCTWSCPGRCAATRSGARPWPRRSPARWTTSSACRRSEPVAILALSASVDAGLACRGASSHPGMQHGAGREGPAGPVRHGVRAARSVSDGCGRCPS
ncbi:hypothetical protein [Actinomycetospora sp. CA-053990]|uniref:hypothetical protein n=1 Tax=Actinomycetospora sp. CA-053990 TaxID=3239891 RepID=UPI003D94E480